MVHFEILLKVKGIDIYLKNAGRLNGRNVVRMGILNNVNASHV